MDVMLPSGQRVSSAAIAFAEETLRVTAAAAEPEIVTDLLEKLASANLAAEFRAILAKPTRKGYADARHWSRLSCWNHARSLYDVKIACDAEGIDVNSICDLSSERVIKAVKTRFGVSQNASRILRGIRPLLRHMGSSTRKLGDAIKDCSRAPRRDDGVDLPTWDTVLASAIQEFQLGLLMIVDGQAKRGKTRARDAILLLVEVEAALRRGEFGSIEVEATIFDAAEACINIIVSPEHSKVRRLQLCKLHEPQTIKAVLKLMEGRESGKLFQTNAGTDLTPVGQYKALKRVGERTVSVKLNFNKMRKINTSRFDDVPRMRATLRHEKNSDVAEKKYASLPDDIMIDEVRDILNTYK
jgi:hypothetical protein